MINRESLKEKLRSKLNFCKQRRQSVESKINNVEKQDKKKDSSIYENETSKNKKKRRKNCRKEVTQYNGGKQELNLTPEQQQEFFANMMKQREEVQKNPEPEPELPNNNITLSSEEEEQLKELNQLIDLKDDLTNKNGELLINHEKSDRIVEIINNIKETDTYQKYANENIDVINDVPTSNINEDKTNHPLDIVNDTPEDPHTPVSPQIVNPHIDDIAEVSSNIDDIPEVTDKIESS